MSRVLEKSFGGLLTSLIGSGSPLGNVSLEGLKTTQHLNFTTLGLVNFVEKLEAARKISKQEEEDIVREEYQEWLRQASHQNIKNEIIADYLCRSLIAFSRGHYFSNLHINAIKLTQSEKLLNKKIGYLYISRTMPPGSDLTVLLVNTIQRDLASPNVIQISLGLSLLPVIISLDMSSHLSNSLASCLGHPQSYIKRRAAVMATSFISQNIEFESSFTSLTSHLKHLLMDTDPAVAIAAIRTFSSAFKHFSDLPENKQLRDEVSQVCAHILLQATAGSLSHSYNIGPINAPFIQVSLLRAIRNFATAHWIVPKEVITAIESVLLQPWGGRNLTLYMTLLEGVMTVTSLPRNEALISHSLKIVLGFLKSSFIDFKYLGIKALMSVFQTLEDTLTKAHLEAVLECLDNPCLLLQSKTVKLLCSMANESNYQAICTTLMQFSQKTSNSSTKSLVLDNVSQILKRINIDLCWAVTFLSPILEDQHTKQGLLDSLKICIAKSMDKSQAEGNTIAVSSACNKLLNLLLKGEVISTGKLNTVAYVLNLLFAANLETKIEIVEFFIGRIKAVDKFENSDDIFTCLLNCGLFIPECKDKVVWALKNYLNSKELYPYMKSKEKLLLLNDHHVTRKVLEKSYRIQKVDYKPDLTLSFLDSLVIGALERGVSSYKPFTIKTRSFAKDRERRAASFNPFDAKGSSSTGVSTEKESVSSCPSFNSSVCGETNVIGISPKSKTIWTSKGRQKPKSESENDSTSSLGSGCVEIAHEAEENSVIDEKEADRKSASTFLESQKIDLTQALLKGLGLSKN